ncbi:family 78 glycoside hydrolase catalytic domain [Streptomyces sp. NPDC048291]|uniref:family 78 glycoside hydrolase catalytic domain n=1 Tax=Streptomyces sp. NPDC048291 TaxID=3365530 RepID=UPI00371B729D
MPRPTRLRVEHLDDSVLGTDVLRPRLSWWLPVGSSRQTAYRIRTADWDSGRLEGGDTVLVPFPGPEPSPGERVTWRVKVWTDLGESDWSEPAFWERLPFSPATSASARWIEPAEDEPAEAGVRPAHLLRHEFTLDAVPRQARVHATAHGLYELFVNGVRVGDHELAPGFTAYRSRLHVQTYDVTALLRPGGNVIGAVLSDGWFRGRTGFHRIPDGYGTRTAFWAVLRAEADEATTEVVTGPGWFSRPSEIVAADLMDGQRTDLTQSPDGWGETGADMTVWAEARVADGGLYDDTGRLTTSPAPPVRRIEELAATSVTRPRPGVHVVDFGQILSGWVRLADLGPEGTELTLTHGESLDTEGDVTTGHLVAIDGTTGKTFDVGQVDRVVSAGRPGEVFEPRHTTHGFRYVRIEGHPGVLEAESVRAVAVHSDMRRTGWFRCSDEMLNRLHEAAVWSFRGNACDVPTDCPTRERAGFTGDWQVFAPAAAFVYDVAGFSAKWLADLAADQWPDGRVPNWAPEPGLDQRSDPTYSYINGSAGWGDAAVIVPSLVHQLYGDERILRDQYASMGSWVDFAAAAARDGRFPSRAEERPEPAPHEQYLWDSGFHWGEWLEPVQGNDELPFYFQDQGIVATAYLYHSSLLLARAAEVLGEQEDAVRHSTYAQRVLDAWRAEFIRPDGSLTRDTQATYVRALAFGLVPEELRAPTAARLVELIRKADNHLGTGFLATPYLLPVLADTGHLDVAYEVLLQDTTPSWLGMIRNGATTIWENWEGTSPDGSVTTSLNHYSKGAVISFLHRYVAGISPREDAPGYQHFYVRPRPGGGLTSAEAEFDSVRGRIAVKWLIEDGRFRLDLTVPPDTTATVTLPDGHVSEAAPGDHHFTCAAV